MRKFLIAVTMVAAGASLGACNRQEPAADADVAGDANVVVTEDENAVIAADENVVASENSPAAVVNDTSTNDVTEQGSTDHGSTDH